MRKLFICVMLLIMMGCGFSSKEINEQSSKTEKAMEASNQTKVKIPITDEEKNQVKQKETSVENNILDDSQTLKSGQYKCGVDIEPGLYMSIAEENAAGYMCISSDANGEDIIHNAVFENNVILEISDGEYLELTDCTAYRYENAPEFMIENGILRAGHYKVGEHIVAGEYKLRSTSDSAYFALSNDANEQDIVTNGVFEGERYISISDGQYLKLDECELLAN